MPVEVFFVRPREGAWEVERRRTGEKATFFTKSDAEKYARDRASRLRPSEVVITGPDEGVEALHRYAERRKKRREPPGTV